MTTTIWNNIRKAGRILIICTMVAMVSGCGKPKNPAANKQLIAAAKAGHTKQVDHALKKGANINASDKNGITALMFAIINKHTATALVLLEQPGIKVNMARKDGAHTALSYAVTSNNVNVVKALLKYPKINVNVTDRSGNTALMDTMVETRDTRIGKALLAHPGININQKNSFKLTALERAAFYGNIDMVNALLKKHNIKANSQNKIGETALFVAAKEGNPQVVIALLNHPGIEVNLRDEYDRTAVDISKSHYIKQILRKHGGKGCAEIRHCHIKGRDV